MYVKMTAKVSLKSYLTMVGPSVNLAARLMGKAKPWQVLVEETVHDAALIADSSWIFHPQPPVKAKGYDHMVAVFVPEQDAKHDFICWTFFWWRKNSNLPDLWKTAIV